MPPWPSWLAGMEDIVAKDTPVLMKCLSEVNEKLRQLNDHVKVLQQLAQSSKTHSELEILELKNSLLNSYLTDLVYMVLMKCGGVDDSLCASARDRSAEIRTILEKMRPIEQRFSYRLDKLLRTTAATKTTAGVHPLQFRPAPENLISKVALDHEQDSAAESEDERVGGVATGVYVPPKVVAMPYSEGSTKNFPTTQVEKSRLIRELREELTDFPAEVETFEGGFKRRKLLGEDRVKRSYEEEHMVRLSNRRKSQNMGRTSHKIQDVVDFSPFKGIVKGGKVKKKKTARR